MGGAEGLEGGPCLAIWTAVALKLLVRRAFGWTFAGQWPVLCSSPICVTKIVSAGEGRGTLIGIMGAVTRGDGREWE